VRLKSIIHFLLLGGLLLSMSCALTAQVTTTNIYGRVTDTSGSSIANATVLCINLDTRASRTVRTNGDGEYRIDLLPAGSYEVKVSAEKFATLVRGGIALQVNEPAHIDITLPVGKVSEIVQVNGGAPQVNTENAEVGTTVESKEIANLPLVNRNVYTLLSTTPGVQSSQNSIVLGFPQQVTIINGGADGGAGSVSYYLDGGLNMTGLRNTGNILPNPDAIREFRVETSNYNAAYGRMSGAVINVITNQGTDAFHGSLFEFYRTGQLNANNWGSVLPTPTMLRNQFGATFGGPIQHGKTFFFGSYSGLRQNTSQFLTGAIVPTGLERTGDFSQSTGANGVPIQVLVPAGSHYAGQTVGKPFVCNGVKNVICPAFLDPTAMNILNYVPGANIPGSNGFQGTVPNPYNTDEFLLRFDHILNDHHSLSGSYFETSGNNAVAAGSNPNPPASALPWSDQQFTWRQHNVNLSDTWTPSNNIANQSWFTFTRLFGGRLNTPGTSLGDLGSQFTAEGVPSLPQINVTNYFTLANAIAGPSAGSNFYSLRDVLAWTHGHHALSFGAELSLDKDIQQTLLNNYGVFTFNSTGETGNGLANFLLGLPTTASQDAPVTAYDNFWSTGLFVQDDYKIHPRLMLNLGLRWDIQTPPTDPLDREATFVLGQQSTVIPSAPRGDLFTGDTGVTRGTVPTRLTHFSPRFGLAWDPFGDGKTAIRGGAGIFYGSVSGNEWNTTTNFEPYAIRYTLPNIGTPSGGTLTCPYTGLTVGAPVTCSTNGAAGKDPFPYNYSKTNPLFLPGGSIYGFSEDFQWPYTYQYNLSVQRQITSDFSMSVAYIGNTSHNLPFAVDLNYPVLTPTATSSSSNILSRRPIDTGTLGQILQVQSNQTGWYNGLQLVAPKKMSRHFLVNASYTYSKTLNSAQVQNSTNQGLAQDYSNTPAEKGLSDFDARHYFVASIVWDVHYYWGGSHVLGEILNGWQVSPIITLHSGFPFTVLNGKDANLDGVTNDRAEVLPGVSLTPAGGSSATEWFNTAAFAQNPVKTGVAIDGNSPRNFLTGPGYRDVDVAIFRNFNFMERFNLQARLESTNAFNMVSLNNPSGNGATVGSTTFGQITSAAPMRQLQIGLRLGF